MTLAELAELLKSEKFHHATDKPNNGCWSGLYIYSRSNNATGFDVAGVFSTYKPTAEQKSTYEIAYKMVAHTGVSLGSRGNG